MIAIDASRTPTWTKIVVRDTARDTAASVGGEKLGDNGIVLIEDQAQPNHGVRSKKTVDAIREG